eukprot:2252311-Pyramimonas_sp.AAC.1
MTAGARIVAGPWGEQTQTRTALLSHRARRSGDPNGPAPVVSRAHCARAQVLARFMIIVMIVILIPTVFIVI